MRAVRTLLLFVFFGTVGTVLVRVLYKGLLLIQSGVARDSIPLERLVWDHMLVLEYAIYGAAGGAAIGFVALFIKMVGYLAMRMKRRADGNRTSSDPDALIRADREAKADAYMAKRRRGQAATE